MRKEALFSVFALMALSLRAGANDEWYKLSWAPWDVDNPGCNMAFNCEAGWWVGLGLWTYGPKSGDPYTVYRDGVCIASGTTTAPTYFTDYDVVPGTTYMYTIESTFKGMFATISNNFTCAYIYGADLSRRELAFGATGGNSAEKFVFATLYRQTAAGKTNISLFDATVSCSGSWIGASIVDGGLNVWVTPNNADDVREGTVTLSYKGCAWPINVTQAGKRPPNDAFASAIALSGHSGYMAGDSAGATAESGEPLHADMANNSVWWTWTAPALGTATFSTAGSAFDTVLAVYTGSSVSALTEVASNDDAGSGGTSRVTFNTAGAGTVYRIAVAGCDSASGKIVLSWHFEARNAATFTGCSVNASGSFHVAFKAKKDLTYKLQRCEKLGGGWTTVATIVPSVSGTVERDVSIPSSWGSGFVRVVVEE